MTTFADLGLSQPLLDGLAHLGYERPTPIQEQAIPTLREGRDMIGQAQTGTGKTAAFGLPLLEFVDPGEREVQALVLTPTRELCIQVTQALRAYGERRGVQIVAVFGGAPIRGQVAQLKEGAQVVVGTVGRVMDLMGRHELVLSDARYVVLDEADEMLDLGFLEDVETILSSCPSGRQTSLFSATIPSAIAKLAEKHMLDPVTIRVQAPTLTIDTVEQFHVEVASEREKSDALARVLTAERPDQAIVFVRTKIGADRLARALSDKGLRVKALHGDMSQGSRDGVMISFKEGRQPLLVATDIAARGLDISGVTHVVNYDVPTSPDVYVHRIGRTGRVGRSGRAITLISPRQRRELQAIERHAGTEIGAWPEDATAAAAANGGARVPRGQHNHPDLPGSPDVGLAVAVEADGDGTPPAPAKLTAGRSAAEPGRQPRRPRHTKPRRRPEGSPRARIVIGAGRVHGIEPADVVSALVERSGLEGEDIEHVRVLERFSLAEVPAERASQAVERVGGSRVKGRELRLQVLANGSPGAGGA
ncbi:MAG TPA: DEAD/DEAH box helicase [Thermoleophilaceae bacterium]|nr:DEAD/DEAH box helicase [Thermoleophilaceae bacterium]